MVVLPKGETKPMPGFSRYTFFRSGKVYNTATGNEIKSSVETAQGPAMQLTNDLGKRKAITVAAVKELFKVVKPTVAKKADKAPATTPTEAQPASEKKMGKRQVFDYDIAVELRRRINTANSEIKWKDLGVEYDVHPMTVKAIYDGKRFKTQKADLDYVNGKSDKRGTVKGGK